MTLDARSANASYATQQRALENYAESTDILTVISRPTHGIT